MKKIWLIELILFVFIIAGIIFYYQNKYPLLTIKNNWLTVYLSDMIVYYNLQIDIKGGNKHVF